MGFKTILQSETTRGLWQSARNIEGGMVVNAYREADGSIVYGQAQSILGATAFGRDRETKRKTRLTDQLLSIPYRIRVWPKRQLTPADYRTLHAVAYLRGEK